MDFFFILSGYVVGYAYDNRWDKLSLTDFFRRRLCRLHPMIVFSTLFGMALFYFASDKFFDPQNAVGMIASCPVWKLCLAGLLGILMIPMPIAWDIRGWNGLYETGVVLALFPLVVAAGAGSEVRGRSAAICRWLGEISYPLYIVQYPIVYGLVGSWQAEHPNAPLAAVLTANIVGFCASILVAQLALTFYDKPVRKWLAERR